MVADVSWVATSWLIVAAVGAIAALIAGSFSTFFISKVAHAEHHAKHHSRKSKKGGMFAGVLKDANPIHAVSSAAKSTHVLGREAIISAEMSLVVFFVTIMFGAACYLLGFTSLNDFGLASAATENIYSLMSIATIVIAAHATATSVNSVGAAFPIYSALAFLTGIALFITACTPSGSIAMWGVASAGTSLAALLTVGVIFVSAETKMSPWNIATLGWYLLYIAMLLMVTVFTFNVNVFAPGGAYYIVYPIMHLAYGLIAIPLFFVSAAFIARAKSVLFEEVVPATPEMLGASAEFD